VVRASELDGVRLQRRVVLQLTSQVWLRRTRTAASLTELLGVASARSWAVGLEKGERNKWLKEELGLGWKWCRT
jgi:hypothetical protein